MERLFDRKALYPITVFLIVALTYCLTRSAYTIVAASAVIAVCLGILLAVTNIAPGYKLMLLCIPLSLEMDTGFGDSKLLFPSEILIIVLFIAYALKFLFIKKPDRAFLHQPLSLLLLFYIGVMILTSFTSQLPSVSVKYTLVMTAYIVVFYFLTYELINSKAQDIKYFYFFYAATMMLIIWYALYRHSMYDWDAAASGMVVRKFYPDHAMYSACLSMMLPAFLVFSLKSRLFNLKNIGKALTIGMTVAMIVGIFFSYSRATWISILAAIAFLVILKLRIKPVYIGGFIIIVLLGGLLNLDLIYDNMRQNKSDSTGWNSNLEEQTKSITSATDASNAERLNRWSCAWRMFLDKPLTGFGPGTYQFEYLSYQRPNEMTRISVTSPYNNLFGRGGSAHSEYLLTLSESGLLGFLLFTAIVLYVIYIGMQTYYNAKHLKLKLITLSALLGMFTFSVHAVFNNFLNNNKAASLFWFLICVIVWADMKIKSPLNKTKNDHQPSRP